LIGKRTNESQTKIYIFSSLIERVKGDYKNRRRLMPICLVLGRAKTKIYVNQKINYERIYKIVIIQ